MPEFSLHATYCTRTGRMGERNVLRAADNLTAAMRQLSAELSRKGYTKIDIRGWPANTWKELSNA